jgi:pyrroloquinoline quinone (PQQ) biosynthesis protein C
MSIELLKTRLEETVAQLMSGPNLERVLTPGFADKRLYAIYLMETYHYTRHNSRNQALIATRPENIDPRYLKFCLRHAEEEVGHELMALHDIKAMGHKVDENSLPQPLNSTTALISYLYYVSANSNPLARLGYSFWAERSYQYIRPLLTMLSDGLGIEKKAMTFFNEHSEIDIEHAKQVDETILRFAKTQNDWDEMGDCLETSLRLTSRMMDEVFEEFIKIKEGKLTRYQSLL